MSLNELFIEVFKNKDFLSAMAVIILVTLVNYNKVLGAISDYKFMRVKHLNRILETQGIDEITKEILTDQRNNALFHSATGINCEKHFREELLRKYKEAKGAFTLKQIQVAMQYIDRKKIEIRVTRFDFFVALINTIGSFFFLLLFMMLMQLPFFTDELKIQTFIWSWGLALTSFIVAFLLFFQVVVLFITLKKLKPALNK